VSGKSVDPKIEANLLARGNVNRVLKRYNATKGNFMLKLRTLEGLITMACLLSQNASAADQRMFVGTHAEQQGIYASTLDLETGEFGPARAVGDAPRPGFLALHPKLPLLYAVTQEKKDPVGGLRAFRFDSATGELTLLGQQSTGDEGATHLALDRAGKAIVVAHYSGGSTAVLPLDDEGALQPRTSLTRHSGSGAMPDRQKEPHAHGVAIDASGQFACVADLGTDEVIVYRLLAGEKLERHAVWNAHPGAGPRHLAFHPNGRWLYCINELDSTLNALIFDSQTGKLTELQTVGTLPPAVTESNSTAEVVVHPSGKFVYGSNRGHDSTAVFAINAETGRLTFLETEPTQGGHPRFIGIEPSGKYLIAANRDADNLVSFQINLDTGTLTPTGHEVSIPQPVCVVFPP